MPPKKSADTGRRCGTPGCTLPDFHNGPCNTAMVSGKRPRVSVVAPVPQKARRPKGDAPARPQPKPPAVQAAPEPPAQQRRLSSGLHRFYHSQRWGVPFPDGPVEPDVSDDRAEESWRLQQTDRRIAARGSVSKSQASLMAMWNAHVHAQPPLVSDRMLSQVCRKFAVEHAAALAGPLRQAFVAHLAALWEHNLLHRDDVHDCINLVDGNGSLSTCQECLRPVHERHCALFGVPRGSAAWPAPHSMAGTQTLPFGNWQLRKRAPDG